MSTDLSGVYPIVPTIFHADGTLALDEQRRVVDWMVGCGADGVVFPGVASEFDQLTTQERTELAALVAEVNARRSKLVIGVSSPDVSQSQRFAAQAKRLGAAGIMAMNPPGLRDDRGAITAWYRDVAAAGVTVILQNAPPPLGSSLPMEFVAELVASIPGLAYVKEEALPCGQRITRLLSLKPRGLAGVFGGAGGRYITDELARGAVGTMPAAELTDVHVKQFAAHRAGDGTSVRRLYNRMLPLLNMQAVFRMRLTKEVLKRRGVITQTHVRAPTPEMDEGDFREMETMLAEIADLLTA